MRGFQSYMFPRKTHLITLKEEELSARWKEPCVGCRSNVRTARSSWSRWTPFIISKPNKATRSSEPNAKIPHRSVQRLHELAKKLPAPALVQCHREYIVNLNRVRALTPRSGLKQDEEWNFPHKIFFPKVSKLLNKSVELTACKSRFFVNAVKDRY